MHQELFVNGRPVRDELRGGAVRGAYQDFVARDRHPVVALNVELPTDLVDVNVHPAKAEVRFRDAGLVRGLIVGSLRHALPAAGLLRFAERGAQLELDTLNFDLRQAYKAQAEARLARWELLAQKLRVLLTPVSTQSEMVEQLREYLHPQRPVKKQ